MKSFEIPPKRNSRSQTLIDRDDLKLLLLLCPSVLGKSKKMDRGIEFLKKNMNMSPSALIVHLKRLNALGFIEIYRVPPENKRKMIIISDSGEELKRILLKGLSRNIEENKKN